MGTNSLIEVGLVAQTQATGDLFDQYRNAMSGDMVPRTAGVPTTEAGDLGTSSYKWSNISATGSITTEGSFYTTGNGHHLFGGQLLFTEDISSIAAGGSVDFDIFGTGFVGHLYAEHESQASATQRTNRIYSVAGRLNDGVTITQEFTANGGTSAFGFTITDNSSTSVNRFTITNDEASTSKARVSFVGMIF